MVPKNIVLITVDALRKDRLECYGNTEGLTPALDEISRNAIVCKNCFTTSSATSVSIASILTSKFPWEHGTRFVGDKIDKKEIKLPHFLKPKYNTVGFSSVRTINSSFGFNDGFDEYYDHINEYAWLKKLGVGRYNLGNFLNRANPFRKSKHRILGHEINSKVEAWLKKKGDEPFFMWIHYFDVHAFAESPGPWNSSVYSGDTKMAENMYDKTVKEFDRIFSNLISILKNNTDFSRTVTIITADHGEMLGEKPEFTDGVSFTEKPGTASTGYYLHGNSLHNSEITVPLIIKGLDIDEGILLNDIVRTVDISPTILDILNIPKADHFRGESILNLIDAPDQENREAYMESMYADKKAIGYNGWKLIVNGRNYRREQPIRLDKNELYNINLDPLEKNNLIDEKPDLASELKIRLQNLENSVNQDTSSLNPPRQDIEELDSEVLEALQDMGYI